MIRGGEDGVVLVNVLVILAIASSLIFLMLDRQDLALDRAQQMSAAITAEALARGGEASVVTALRRDLEEAPQSDHLGEAWAEGQANVELQTGGFSIQVRDAQSRLDLNRLRTGAATEAQVFARLFRALDLPPAELRRAAIELAGRPGVTSPAQLDSLSPDTRAKMAPYVDILPRPSPINLNTAPDLLVRTVLANPSAATRILAIRKRNGVLTPEDFARVGALVPPGAGLVSSVFDARILAEVDGIKLRLESRILRDTSGKVRVVRRRFGPDISIPLPDGR